MVFFRWFVGLPLAAIITAGLFAMMAGLIQQDTRELPEAIPYPDLDIWAEEPKPDPDPFKPPRPDPNQKPPETVIPPTGPVDEPGPVIDTTPTTPIGPGERGTVTFPKPVIKYPPPYPENCRSRAAEGIVTVQFDVTAEGNVVKPRIIQTADRCFNRTVLATVSKWKYPPATRGDRAVMRRGVIEVIRFTLEE